MIGDLITNSGTALGPGPRKHFLFTEYRFNPNTISIVDILPSSSILLGGDVRMNIGGLPREPTLYL